MTAVAVPGATLFLAEQSAAAAVSPYAMASWEALLQQRIQVAGVGQSSVTLQVIRVTNFAGTTTTAMTGDSFIVDFQAPAVVAPQIYTVTAPGLGTFHLFLGGAGSVAHAAINRRLPA